MRLGGCTRGLTASAWAMPRSIGLSGPFFVLVLGTRCQGLYIGVSILPTLVLCCGKTAANRPIVVSALAERGGKKCTSARKPKKNILQGTFHGALKTCLRVKSGQTEHGKALIGGAGEPPYKPRRPSLRAHNSASVTRSAAAQQPSVNTAPIAHAAK